MAQSVSKSDLERRIRRTEELLTEALKSFDVADKAAKTQLITGINKSYGQAAALYKEYFTKSKAKIKKRDIILQLYSDITEGKADELFAKSTEVKSISSKQSVKSKIKEAFTQLARAETAFADGVPGKQRGPRKEDVRVVAIWIEGEHQWPAPNRRPLTVEYFQKFAEMDVKDCLNKNKEMSNWLKTGAFSDREVVNLRDVPSTAIGGQRFPRSTRPVYRSPAVKRDAEGVDKTPAYPVKIRCLTIKIRYDPGYPLEGSPSSELKSFTIQCFKKASVDEIHVQIVKLVKSVAVDEKTYRTDTNFLSYR